MKSYLKITLLPDKNPLIPNSLPQYTLIPGAQAFAEYPASGQTLFPVTHFLDRFSKHSIPERGGEEKQAMKVSIKNLYVLKFYNSIQFILLFSYFNDQPNQTQGTFSLKTQSRT